ncbi:MAG TPA: DUF1343 domain-containing protein [Gemmatales bacterium]|nr:DUF1343 domain-containing protein [Gemmatales bacterium]
MAFWKRAIGVKIGVALCLLIVLAASAQTDVPWKQEVAELVQKAIAAKQLPGAVVLVAQQGKILLHEAYGQKALVPQPEKMTQDTIFDMASLTKPIVTATCIMKLVEEDKLNVSDKASWYLPNFGQNGKIDITIEQLLLHTGGLVPDNAQDDYEHGLEHAYSKIDGLKLTTPPGARFIYSDVGYIVLGRIIEKITGQPLDAVAQRMIFEPLGLQETGYRRISKKQSIPSDRSAPTEKEGDGLLRGVVHDPRARQLDGVAGHAGLFSSSRDLMKYAQMLLNLGHYEGKTILKPETVRLMTLSRHVPGGGMRSYGWDIDTGYSAPRGDRFPVGLSFGHTGYTGTSLWIDPTSQSFVIILTNRVHPDDRGDATLLRRGIGSLVARKLPIQPARSPVQVGIDVLRKSGFKVLENKRVGLVTNQTGVARDGTSTIDVLYQAPKVKLVALFSPEHGIRGVVDEKVSDSKDEKTGLPIYNLYGESRKPTKEQLKDIDVLLYDIQDIGTRFYTYISTLGLVLEAASENKIKVIVLDRPNPIGGVAVQGPMLDAGKESFIAWHKLPVRHGMTVGELAQLFNTERRIGADLTVVKMVDWRREDEFDRTGLVWINPSPNMRTLQAALLYPGVGLLETTNLNVGRGTDRPFELIGAPWVDAVRWAQDLQLAKVPGVRFMPSRFTPASSEFAKVQCQGVSIVIEDCSKLDPVRVGFSLAVTLKRLYPRHWKTKRLNELLLSEEIFQAIEQGAGVEELLTKSKKNLEEFIEVRKRYLLY